MKIFKYTMPTTVPGAPFPVELPMGAKRLHYEAQDGRLCLWAEVYPDAPTVGYLFQWYGTGWPVHGIHQTTLQQGAFVWHLYDVTEFEQDE